MATIVRFHDVPGEIWPLSGMDDYDYVDVFSADVPRASDATPEEWARAALEQGAGPGGQVLWRGILGLRLHPSPEAVGGWTIGYRDERCIRLEASSWLMTAHVVVYVYDEQLVAATVVRYDRLLGALVWSAVSGFHRRAVPVLLRKAMKSVGLAETARTYQGGDRG